MNTIFFELNKHDNIHKSEAQKSEGKTFEHDHCTGC